MNAYVISFGGSLLVAGRLADSLGLVATLRFGLVLLILGSVVAAVAPSAGTFFAGRAMQGLGSSLAAAASLALILKLFKGEERRAALGLLAAMAGLGGAIGIFSGGLLAEAWGWRATFVAIVAAAAILLVAATVFLVRDDGRARLAAKPLAGGLLLLVGQILLIYTIICLGENGPLAVRTVVIACAATASLTVFVILQKNIRYALIPMSFLGNSAIRPALLLAAMVQMAIFPSFFMGNFFLQEVAGLTSLQSGAAFLPLCGVAIIVAAVGHRILRRFSIGAVMSLAFALASVGLLLQWVIIALGWTVADYILASLLIGAALPLLAMTTSLYALSHAQGIEFGTTSGVLTSAQQIGAAVGLAGALGIRSATDILPFEARTVDATGDAIALLFLSSVAFLGMLLSAWSNGGDRVTAANSRL